ncbi:TIGR04066 family peptide maturation system protein [Clostridium botulinum]|nr:TIGR04066 family peptide maturation system protein [Clostridium botulinum]NFL55795.1 TIGR04066 family peptide maturation system protein [Clostridium botulinum]
MNNKEKALIYPYDREFSTIIRHQSMCDYEIVGVVAPNGWGLSEKDASYVDGGQALNIIVNNNFESMLNNCDTLILSNSALKLDFKKSIYPKVVQAAEKNKKIISTAKFDIKEIEMIEEVCKYKGNIFIQYPLNKNYEICSYVDKLEIQEIKTPVIFVMGVGENAHKFEIQLSVRENLFNMGYKVSQVGSRDYCEMFNFHSFPKFMYSNMYSETEKIKLFNNFIKNIENQENPDVIIIGIPGTIMRINNKATYDFGVLAFEVSQAVKPDTSVLSVLYENYLPSFFEKIAQEVKYKFACDISCFNYVNSMIDWNYFEINTEAKYIDVTLDLVNNKINELNNSIPIFNIMNENEGLKITEHLIDKLACEEYEVL